MKFFLAESSAFDLRVEGLSVVGSSDVKPASQVSFSETLVWYPVCIRIRGVLGVVAVGR